MVDAQLVAQGVVGNLAQMIAAQTVTLTATKLAKNNVKKDVHLLAIQIVRQVVAADVEQIVQVLA